VVEGEKIYVVRKVEQLLCLFVVGTLHTVRSLIGSLDMTLRDAPSTRHRDMRDTGGRSLFDNARWKTRVCPSRRPRDCRYRSQSRTRRHSEHMYLAGWECCTGAQAPVAVVAGHPR
jgi:hypothetical protein